LFLLAMSVCPVAWATTIVPVMSDIKGWRSFFASFGRACLSNGVTTLSISEKCLAIWALTSGSFRFGPLDTQSCKIN
jgi:hypothetical protein